jgi:ABC-type nitrate/sulfonate/bicarbonate transport system substrate-binding protein
VVASLVDMLRDQLPVGPPGRPRVILKRRRFCVSTRRGSAHVAARLALKHIGLDPKRERIGLVQIGADPERLAALVAGSIDGAIVAPGTAARLPMPPFRTLMDLRRAGIPWVQTCLVTTRRFARSHPAIVDGALRALAEGTAFVLDPRNAEAVKAVIARHLGLGEPAVVEEGYRNAIEEIAWKPIPDLAGIGRVLETMAALGIVEDAARLRPQDFVDQSLMQKLDQEGLLDRLRPRR